MGAYETSGLAAYQQTVNQTPGFASSTWVQGTSSTPPVIVQIVPPEMPKEEKQLAGQETA